jgi:hypothetical protein
MKHRFYQRTKKLSLSLNLNINSISMKVKALTEILRETLTLIFNYLFFTFTCDRQRALM